MSVNHEVNRNQNESLPKIVIKNQDLGKGISEFNNVKSRKSMFNEYIYDHETQRSKSNISQVNRNVQVQNIISMRARVTSAGSTRILNDEDALKT